MTHPQDPSDSSFLSLDLHDLLPPSRSAPSVRPPIESEDAHSSSAYGGIAPSTTVGATGMMTRNDNDLHANDYDNEKRARFETDTVAETGTERSFVTALPCTLPPRPQSAHHPSPPTFIPYSPSERHSTSGRTQSNTLHPPTPTPHSHSQPSSHPSNELPTFSRWSPTWISGGYSSGGEGWTNHTPPLSSRYDPPDFPRSHVNPIPPPPMTVYEDPYSSPPPNQYRYQEEVEEGDVGGYGWIPSPPVKSSFDSLGGDYYHGVGFTSQEKSWMQTNRTKESQEKIDRRMKKLEKEFGEVAVGAGAGGEGGRALSMKEKIRLMEEEKKREKMEMREKSGVDGGGRLVLGGRKKRSALRWVEGLMACAVAFGSYGTSLFTHPTTPPPQAHRVPFYTLYLLPLLSLCLLFYFFLIKPCQYRSQQRRLKTQLFGGNALMMPLTGNLGQIGGGGGGGGGCCGCGGRNKGGNQYGGVGGKKGKDGMGMGGQQINLVIDPRMMPHLGFGEGLNGGRGRERELEKARQEEERKKRKRRRKRKQKARERKANRERRGDVDGNDSDVSLTSSLSSSTSLTSLDSSSDLDPTQRRLDDLFQAPSAQLLQTHQQARTTLKWILTIDLIIGMLWIVCVIWVLFSKGGGGCKVGTFQGFCNYYNTAIAFAVLEGLAFLASFVFDCLDMRRSRGGPMGGIGGGGVAGRRRMTAVV